jgi:arabinofuranosyltransferase
MLDGFGPVFNIGERVQEYTHHLWYILLLLGCWLGLNPIFLSIGYGLLFTILTVGLLGNTLSRMLRNRVPLVILVGLACLIWSLSDPWLSFQTGGLENSLSNLLITGILIEGWVHSMKRPIFIILLVSLLCLTRPDFFLLSIPIAILIITSIRSVRMLTGLAIAASPALAWLLFAWTYYGNVLPNTAYAKLGIYPNLIETIVQGIRYFQDWLMYDTVAAVGTVLLLGYAFVNASSKERMVCVISVVLYAAWIIWIGGDFMRGRMFTPVLTDALVVGFLSLAERSARLRYGAITLETGVAACIIAILLFLHESIPDPGATMSDSGIANERKYYPG